MATQGQQSKLSKTNPFSCEMRCWRRMLLGEGAWQGAEQDYSAGRAQVSCAQITQMQGYFGGFGQELQMVCDKHIPGTSLALNNSRTNQPWACSRVFCPSQRLRLCTQPWFPSLGLILVPKCCSSPKCVQGVVDSCPGSCVPLGSWGQRGQGGNGSGFVAQLTQLTLLQAATESRKLWE